ncbi:MAG: DUF2284 domain-containing protein [Dehalococcoidia bacterium]
MQALEARAEKLVAQALEGGASVAKLISAEDVFVAPWVRQKCQWGCRHFGKRFTCPPYAPSPEETAETLKMYQRALLVGFYDLRRDEMQETPRRLDIHRLLYELERTAFLEGYHKALSYGAGPCRLCPECPAEKLENPSLFYTKECKVPKEARPSMEAAGMDVYATAHRAGFELHVVRERSDPYNSFGLVLLE